ncbi:AraC family transcriptional regulator, partial [Amaricoccus sp. HAR-UPW-R2A-40]
METGGPAIQRAAGLVELPALLGDVPLAQVLAGTGVTPADLRPDAFIPYAAFLDILERAARLTGREDLGLRLGLR